MTDHVNDGVARVVTTRTSRPVGATTRRDAAEAPRREMPSPDEMALTALQSGDQHAIAAVVTAWTPAMLRLAHRHVTSRAAAEDIVQDAWLTVLTSLHRFEGRSALRTWVLGIVVNLARRSGTRERRMLPLSAAWHAERAESNSAAVDPDRFNPTDGTWVSSPTRWDLMPETQQLAAAELRAVVDAAVAELPPRQQAVITVHDIIGLDVHDTRTLFGLTENNQRVLLHRARSRVRAAVESYVNDAHQPTTGVTATPVNALADASPRTRPQPPRPRSSPRPPRATRATRAARRPGPGQPVVCRQLVELVNDYLAGRLEPDLRTRVENHLDQCDGCTGYVAQIRRLLDITSQLAGDVPAPLVARLTTALRSAHVDQTRYPARGG